MYGFSTGNDKRVTDMDYQKVLDECKAREEVYRQAGAVWNLTREENCATAITDLLARAEAAEVELEQKEKYYGQMVDALAATDSMELTEAKKKLKEAEEIASDLCDDFTDFVTGGVHNAAPYCANRRPECVNAHGWCDGDNRVCRGFMPKAAVGKEE